MSMSAKTTVELTREQLSTIIEALDYQHDGLYQEYDLEEKGMKSAPPGVPEVIDRLVTLADSLEEKLVATFSSEK